MAKPVLYYDFSNADKTLVGSVAFDQFSAVDQQVTIGEGLKFSLSFGGQTYSQASDPAALLLTSSLGEINNSGLGLQFVLPNALTINADNFIDANGGVQSITYTPSRVLNYIFSNTDKSLSGKLSFNAATTEDQLVSINEGLKFSAIFGGKAYSETSDTEASLQTSSQGGLFDQGLGLQAVVPNVFTINGDSFVDANTVQSITYTPVSTAGESNNFKITDFTDPSDFITGGSVTTQPNLIRLTAPNEGKDGVSGSTILARQFGVSSSSSFNSKFKFTLGNALGDGFAFVIKDAAVTQTGLAGGYLGYQLDTKATAYNSLAIAFDTHKNIDSDIEGGAATKWDDRSANEVKLLSNGSVFSSLITQTNVVDGVTGKAIKLNSGIALNAWVDYIGQDKQLKVFLSEGEVKPTSALLAFEGLDLVATVGSVATVGFTGATGTDRNTQDIQSFEFNYASKSTTILAADSPKLNLTGENERAFGDSRGNLIDASQALGNNQIFGGDGDDELFAGTSDILNGQNGNDILDATDGKGNNKLFGGAGNDALFAGVNDQLFGDDGDDTLYAGIGGNTLTGGAGSDLFAIATAALPLSINTISDFQVGSDRIAVLGLTGVTSFSDLTLSQQGTATVVSALGTNLASLTGIQAGTLSASSFSFG